MEHARVLSPAPEAPTTTPDPDSLVAQHLPLVGHIVRETAARVPSHVDKDDLSSAGMIALVNASRAFDAERGIPFARYVATRIRGAI
ncbi:MAG TPA: sigma factor, partial [Nocardioides sp.]|nr:sigma factor [Nocardioides sp.]